MLLAESSINVNVADSSGTLPLHLAVNRQNLAMVDALLQANTDVDKWQHGRYGVKSVRLCCRF
jgi:ankyrin repeat protein